MDSLTANIEATNWCDPVTPYRVGGDPASVLKVLRERDTDENSLRSQLAACLNKLIQERRLTQTAVSAIFGIPQSHISELRNLKLSRFSSERLLRFVTLLDRDVEIIIRPKAKSHAVGTVTVHVVT